MLTIDEVRDERATMLYPGGYRYDPEKQAYYWRKSVAEDWSRYHPIPTTIDGLIPLFRSPTCCTRSTKGLLRRRKGI